MLTHHSGSYYDEYRKMKGHKGASGKGDLANERLLTDRASYISFLEVQLERVSAACMTTQAFGERLEEIGSQHALLEEKTRNLARLVKLQQAYTEASNSDAAKAMEQLKEGVAKTTDELHSLQDESVAGTDLESHAERMGGVEERQEELERNIHELRDRVAKAAEAHTSASVAGEDTELRATVEQVATRSDARADALTARLEQLELKVAAQDRALEEERRKRAELSALVNGARDQARDAVAASEGATARARAAEESAARSMAASEGNTTRLSKADAVAAGARAGASKSSAPPSGRPIDTDLEDQLSRRLNARLTDQVARLQLQMEKKLEAALAARSTDGGASASETRSLTDLGSKPSTIAAGVSHMLVGDAVSAEDLNRRLEELQEAVTMDMQDRDRMLRSAVERAEAAEESARGLSEESIARSDAQGDRLMKTIKAVESRFSTMLADLSPETLEARVLDSVNSRVVRIEAALRAEEQRATRIEETARSAELERQAISSTLSLKSGIVSAAHEETLTKIKAQVLQEIGDIIASAEHRLERKVVTETSSMEQRDAKLREERRLVAETLEERMRDGVSKIDRFMVLYNQTHQELAQRLVDTQRSQAQIDRAITAASMSIVSSPEPRYASPEREDAAQQTPGGPSPSFRIAELGDPLGPGSSAARRRASRSPTRRSPSRSPSRSLSRSRRSASPSRSASPVRNSISRNAPSPAGEVPSVGDASPGNAFTRNDALPPRPPPRAATDTTQRPAHPDATIGSIGAWASSDSAGGRHSPDSLSQAHALSGNDSSVSDGGADTSRASKKVKKTKTKSLKKAVSKLTKTRAAVSLAAAAGKKKTNRKGSTVSTTRSSANTSAVSKASSKSTATGKSTKSTKSTKSRKTR